MGTHGPGGMSLANGKPASLSTINEERGGGEEVAFDPENVILDESEDVWFHVEHLASVSISLKDNEDPSPEDGLHMIKNRGGMWTKNMVLNIETDGVTLRDPDADNAVRSTGSRLPRCVLYSLSPLFT